MNRPTSRSYAGRQVDLEALKHVERTIRTQRVHPDVNTDPRIVAGIEKAVQRYAILFLTHLGSVKLAPDVGSTLLHDALSGRVSSLAQLGNLYALANSSARAAMRADDEDPGFGSIPDDERVVDTRLVNMDLDYASRTIRIHVLITTAAGDSFTFIIPVTSGLTM